MKKNLQMIFTFILGASIFLSISAQAGLSEFELRVPYPYDVIHTPLSNYLKKFGKNHGFRSDSDNLKTVQLILNRLKDHYSYKNGNEKVHFLIRNLRPSTIRYDQIGHRTGQHAKFILGSEVTTGENKYACFSLIVSTAFGSPTDPGFFAFEFKQLPLNNENCNNQI